MRANSYGENVVKLELPVYKRRQLFIRVHNIHDVEDYGVEENSLDDLRKAGCTNILVMLRGHDRGLLRVACDLPEGVPPRTNSNLECACL